MRPSLQYTEIWDAATEAGFELKEHIVNAEAEKWVDEHFTFTPLEEDTNSSILRRDGNPIAVYQHGERYDITEVEEGIGRRIS